MKKMRVILASVLVSATIAGTVAATSPAEAATPQLTIDCTPTVCVASGGLGNLLTGVAYLTSHVQEALLCVGTRNPCDVAIAELDVVPNVIFAGVNSGLARGIATVSLRFAELGVSAAGITLFVEASSHQAGIIVLTPGIHKCLVISGLSITAPRC